MFLTTTGQTFSRRDLLRAAVAGGAGAVLAWPLLDREGRADDAAARRLRHPLQPLELHRHRLAVGNRIVRPLGDRRHGDGRSPAAREDLPQHGRPGLRVDGRAVPRSRPAAQEIPRRRKSGTDRRDLRPAHGNDVQRRIEHPADRRRAGDDPQGAGLRDGHLPGGRGVHAIRRSRRSWPVAGFRYASLAQCDTWGRAGMPGPRFQRHPLEGHRRHGDSDHSQELPCSATRPI